MPSFLEREYSKETEEWPLQYTQKKSIDKMSVQTIHTQFFFKFLKKATSNRDKQKMPSKNKNQCPFNLETTFSRTLIKNGFLELHRGRTQIWFEINRICPIFQNTPDPITTHTILLLQLQETPSHLKIRTKHKTFSTESYQL